jgi:hypothetical protein
MTSGALPGNESVAQSRPDYLLIGVLALFAACVGISLTWPMAADTSIFAWMADTVLRGGRPYADALDMKGPGAWLPSLAVQAVFGRTSWGIRVLDALIVLSAFAAIRSIARAAGWHRSGRVGVVLLALWAAGFDYDVNAQPDGFVGCWLLMGCALAVRGGWWRLCVAGTLVGLAAMSKPFFIGFMVVLLVPVVLRPTATHKQRGIEVASALVGAGVAIMACLAMMQATGGLDAFFDVQRWNREVYAGLSDPWTTRFPGLVRGMMQLPWGPVVLIALFGGSQIKGEDRHIVLALMIGLLGAYAALVLQNKMEYFYQWLPTIPFLAILADRGFMSLRSETAGAIAGRIRRSALAIAVVVGALAPIEKLTGWVASRGDQAAQDAYEREQFPFWGRYAGSLYTVVDSLQGHGLRDSSLLVWAPIIGPQFLAGVAPPNRLAVTRVFYDGPGTPQQAQFRNEVLTSLRQHPPRWWVTPRPQKLRRFRMLDTWGMERFPSLLALRNRCGYTLRGHTSDWDIFERGPDAPAQCE